MVFTCSPVGEQFRVRAQRFLAIVNSTVIDWFQPWPEKALQGVSAKSLADVEFANDETRDLVVRFMPYSFGLVGAAAEKYLAQERRHCYTTPKTFLERIKLYTNLLSGKRKSTKDSLQRLETGLEKLNAVSKDVVILVEQAKIKAVQVEEKVVSADAFAEKVGVEKEKAGI
jgi:dynein heavy chain